MQMRGICGLDLLVKPEKDPDYIGVRA